jgi:hypothetical protein
MAAGSIYTARIVKITQKLPDAPPGVINLNCLNFFPNNVMHGIPLYEVVPYCLKDAKGHLHENIYQFSKIYPSVDPQYEVKAGKVIWDHPGEIHVKDGQLTPEYWAWRKKGWENPYAVRYPNGYHGRQKCLCSMWHDGEKWVTYDYVTARKKIYCKTYVQLVQSTTAYKMLKNLYDNGHSLQICEMDVRPGLVTEEVLRRELHNTSQPFGHGFVIAACLMGLTHIFDE